jgi:hypothetical protein
LYPITPQKLLKSLDLVVYIENGWSLYPYLIILVKGLMSLAYSSARDSIFSREEIQFSKTD